ncbi:hypothetical protein KM043_009137 [Ampulex compressa]|nr:hypothetical protein KM043_009137 [Ampulex compressa]
MTRRPSTMPQQSDSDAPRGADPRKGDEGLDRQRPDHQPKLTPIATSQNCLKKDHPETREGETDVQPSEEPKQDLKTTMPELKDEEVEANDEMIALDLEEPPPKEVMEYARREVGETDEVKCQAIHELRELIYERGECLPHRMDDAFLLRFLRAREFNVYRAHRLMVNYYNFKEEHPEVHRNVKAEDIMYIVNEDVITVPPYRTPCGRRMMIYRVGNWDPRKHEVEGLFKGTVVALELGILEPRAQILGGVAIFDLQGITMAHAWIITPQIVSMVMALMVTSFPMKIYAIHILHQSWIFDAIFALFKPLLDAKMHNRIFFHGSNMKSLHKHIPPAHLPKMYEGTREEVPYYKWMQYLCRVPRILDEMEQLGYKPSEEWLNEFLH